MDGQGATRLSQRPGFSTPCIGAAGVVTWHPSALRRTSTSPSHLMHALSQNVAPGRCTSSCMVPESQDTTYLKRVSSGRLSPDCQVIHARSHDHRLTCPSPASPFIAPSCRTQHKVRPTPLTTSAFGSSRMLASCRQRSCSNWQCERSSWHNLKTSSSSSPARTVCQ